MSGPCGLHCLRIENLTVKRHGAVIVDNVSLHAHCGEVTALIGRNGAGKSTLMRALVGELPYSGKVTFSGHDGEPTPRLPKCGYVPQTLSVDPASPITVSELLLCYHTRWPVFLPRRKSDEEKLRAQLARFGAEHLADSRLSSLSGGERQRVLLALAALRKPDLLLLDEPAAGMDREGLKDFYRLIDKFAAEDLLILLISHDLGYVRSRADRAVLMENGKVAACGKPQEVFASRSFAQAFPEMGEDAL